MTVIAHISDLHLLEREPTLYRTGQDWRRVQFCSLFRPLKYEHRRANLEGALRTALSFKPDILAITGDLTEDGTPEQFEALGEILDELEVDHRSTLIVPGNHDSYVSAGLFSWALDAPLRRFRETSLNPMHLGDVVLFPVSNAVKQHYLRSIGRFPPVEQQILDYHKRADPVVVVQHHPPFGSKLPPLRWMDGLQNCGPLQKVLQEHPRIYLVHGHTHEQRDMVVSRGRPPQVFSVKAVVDSPTNVRLYRAELGVVFPI